MFDALFKAVADFSEVKSEAKEAGAALEGMADDAEKSGKRTSDSTDKVGSRAKVAGAAFAGAFSATAIINFAGKVAEFSGKAVESFSQLEDSTAAASVIFGTSMKKIIAQAQGAATALGMSQAQVIDAANTFGTFGKSAGLSGDALANFSIKMTKTAADMASFRGTTPEEAIQAVGAALRGEMEPIRKYGVLLDDAGLKAQAMKMGLIKSTKEGLTPQQKVLAAQALILKQTTDAQGDFARTSDSTANVQKTLTAETENLTAKIGGQLAPAFTQVRTVILGALQGLSGALDWVIANGPQLVPVFAGLGAILLAVLAPAIWAAVAATWAWTVALLANPVTWIVLGIGLLVAAIVWLVMNWDTAAAWITQVWGTFVSWLSGVWNTIVAAVMAFGAQVVAFFVGLWNGIVATAQAAWNGLVSWFNTLLQVLFAVIMGPLVMLALWIIANWDRIQALSMAVWNSIVEFVMGIPQRIQDGLNALAQLPATVGAWFLGVFNAAKEKFGQLVTFIGTIPDLIWKALLALAELHIKAGVWFLGVLDAAKAKFGELVDWVKGVPDKVVSALGDIGSKLYESGKSLVAGFLDGIKKAWDGLVDWVKKGMTQLRGLWPFSPAKWGPFSGRGYVTYSGEAIGDDFASSIQGKIPKVVGSALSMVGSAADALQQARAIDLSNVLALNPDAKANVDVTTSTPPATAGAGGSTVNNSGSSSGDTYHVYIDGTQVGMDPALEGAVRQLVGAVTDSRRLDRTASGQ